MCNALLWYLILGSSKVHTVVFAVDNTSWFCFNPMEKSHWFELRILIFCVTKIAWHTDLLTVNILELIVK